MEYNPVRKLAQAGSARRWIRLGSQRQARKGNDSKKVTFRLTLLHTCLQELPKIIARGEEEISNVKIRPQFLYIVPPFSKNSKDYHLDSLSVKFSILMSFFNTSIDGGFHSWFNIPISFATHTGM